MASRAMNGPGASSDSRVNFGSGAYVANQSAFSLIVWFISSSNSGGNNFANMFSNGGSFPASHTLQLKTTGAVNLFYRDDASNTINITSSTGFDDGKWHCLFQVKRAANDHEWFIDWVSQGTSSTSIGTLTATELYFGGLNNNQMPAGARMARAMLWRRALTTNEAKTAAYRGMGHAGGASGVLWAELGFPTTEPDWSGSGNASTSIGAQSTIGDGFPPVGPPFAYDTTARLYVPAVSVSDVPRSPGRRIANQLRAYWRPRRVA